MSSLTPASTPPASTPPASTPPASTPPAVTDPRPPRRRTPRDLPASPYARLRVRCIATALIAGLCGFTFTTSGLIEHDAERVAIDAALDEAHAGESQSVLYAALAGEEVPSTSLPPAAAAELELLGSTLRTLAQDSSTDPGPAADLARQRVLADHRAQISDETITLASRDGETLLSARGRLDPAVVAGAAALAGPDSDRRTELLVPPALPEIPTDHPPYLLLAGLTAFALATASGCTSHALGRRAARLLERQAQTAAHDRDAARLPQDVLAELLRDRLAELGELPDSPERTDAIAHAEVLLGEIEAELALLARDPALALPAEPVTLLSPEDERLCAIRADLDLVETQRTPRTSLPTPTT